MPWKTGMRIAAKSLTFAKTANFSWFLKCLKLPIWANFRSNNGEFSDIRRKSLHGSMQAVLRCTQEDGSHRRAERVHHVLPPTRWYPTFSPSLPSATSQLSPSLPQLSYDYLLRKRHFFSKILSSLVKLAISNIKTFMYLVWRSPFWLMRVRW